MPGQDNGVAAGRKRHIPALFGIIASLPGGEETPAETGIIRRYSAKLGGLMVFYLESGTAN
jgi:hypothetical protein